MIIYEDSTVLIKDLIKDKVYDYVEYRIPSKESNDGEFAGAFKIEVCLHKTISLSRKEVTMILNPQIQLDSPNIQSKIDTASLQAGDIVWACNFRRNIGGFRYKTKPTKGMIVDNPKCHLVALPDDKYIVSGQNRFFVPFQKSTASESADNLAWSKAVTTSARLFAKTEQESIDLYNTLIEHEQRMLKDLIDTDEKLKIRKK